MQESIESVTLQLSPWFALQLPRCFTLQLPHWLFPGWEKSPLHPPFVATQGCWVWIWVESCWNLLLNTIDLYIPVVFFTTVICTGRLNFREFVIGLSLSTKGDFDEKLYWAFRLYDVDGNGFISRAEMKDIVSVSSMWSAGA